MSLKCPIMFTMIKLPTRGIYCTHLNCFDLESYALMNKSTTSRKYRCPICGLKAYDVYIDEYWMQALKKANAIIDAEEIEIYPDTSYRIITFSESKSRGLGKLNATLSDNSNIIRY